MREDIITKFKELNIYALQPYLTGSEKKDKFKLPFEPPYYLVRVHDFLDDTQINKNLRKKYIIAYIRLNGIKHFLYYLKSEELQYKLIEYVNTSNGAYQIISTLKIHKTDNLYTIHKQLPSTPSATTSTTSNDVPDELAQLPTSTSPNAKPNLFNLEKSQDKPTLYLYKSLLPTIKDYRQFMALCYLLHILKISGTLAVHGTTATISSHDLLALLPSSLKREQRKNRARVRHYNKSYIHFFHYLFSEYIHEVYTYEDTTLELYLSDDFIANIGNPPYIDIPLDFIKEFNRNNYNFLMYFLNYLFQINPKRTFYIRIRTQELLNKTNLVNPSKHNTTGNILNRVNNYFNILFQHHIIPTPYQLSPKDIKENTLLKIELTRFRLAKDFSPIIATYDSSSTGMLNDSS